MHVPEGSAWPDVLVWLGRPAALGERVTLDAAESHHLTRVLRRRPGDAVVLADGEGGWVEGRLVGAGPRGAEIDVEAVRPSPAEPRRPLEMGFPLLRPARTEWLLEKATELGVTRVVPIHTARGRRHAEKPDRWRRLVRSAAMQCLRSKPPEVIAPMYLEEWCCEPREGASFVGAPGGEAPPARLAGAARVVVGPEGDLTPEELSALDAAGFTRVDLGPRRLRAETAALALLAHVGHAQRA